MSFEFLAPDAAVAFDGARRPALRSPIEWAHRDARRRTGERAGWRLVADYGDPAAEAAACERSVGVADLSYLGKLELQGDADGRGRDRRRASPAARALTLGQASSARGRLVVPDHGRPGPGGHPARGDGAGARRARGGGGRRALRLGQRADHGAGLERGGRAARPRDVRPQHGARHAARRLRGARVRPGLGGAGPGDGPAQPAPTRSCTCSAPGTPSTSGPCSSDAAEHLGGRAVGVDALPAEARLRCLTSSASAACGARPAS